MNELTSFWVPAKNPSDPLIQVLKVLIDILYQEKL